MSKDRLSTIRMQKSQIKSASEMFSRAMQEDPLFSYFIPDSSERKIKSKYILEGMIRYGAIYGEVHATSTSLEVAAIWLRSEKAKMSFWMMIRSMGLFWLFNYSKVGRDVMSRMMSYINFSFSTHSRIAPYPHWYLWILGVDPKYQGKGYASTLLKPMFTRIDQENLPCYLETNNEKNIPIYQHYGFKLVEEILIPGTAIRNWVMLRD